MVRRDFIHPLKGKEHGRCNRQACQSPGAFYFNRGMRAYYCWTCANAINAYAVTTEERARLFGDLEFNQEKEDKLYG